MPREDVTTTELIWPGKKTEVDRVSLPFQTVETVNKPRVDQPMLDFGEWPEDYPRDWKNKLIWGDNKYVMASLLKDYAGKIDLIYIDPPFATGANFTVEVEIGDAEVTKEASVIEELAYRDTWGKGLGSYLQMMYERLVLMRELLSEDGMLYVHLDWRVDSYIRLILDEIFGRDNFRNEIVWCYTGPSRQTSDFPDKHDVIYRYSKTDNYVFNIEELRVPYAKSNIATGSTSAVGRASDERLKELDKRGKLVEDWWDDIATIGYVHREILGFPTQKPEALLRRIIRGSSNEGGIVADFFCGSGTTGAVAEKLGRRWIMSDLSRFAIQTTRKRLLNLHGYSKDYGRPARPFEILNMGNYQKHKFIENGYPPVERYISFILELYRAEGLEGFALLHGKKGRRLVHVSGVDSIVTEREVRDTAEECVNALSGKAVDILGWDFEMGLDQLVSRIGAEYAIDIQLVQIPREAMELTSPDAKIRFFDMNYLEVAHSVESRKLVVQLKDFVIANMEYLPEEVRETVDNFTDYIDYWAVDFDYKDDTFHNMWQSFRTRERKQLDKACVHVYDQPGVYRVLVKVIDVFGNDTNKLVEVSVT